MPKSFISDDSNPNHVANKVTEYPAYSSQYTICAVCGWCIDLCTKAYYNQSASPLGLPDLKQGRYSLVNMSQKKTSPKNDLPILPLDLAPEICQHFPDETFNKFEKDSPFLIHLLKIQKGSQVFEVVFKKDLVGPFRIYAKKDQPITSIRRRGCYEDQPITSISQEKLLQVGVLHGFIYHNMFPQFLVDGSTPLALNINSLLRDVELKNSRINLERLPHLQNVTMFCTYDQVHLIGPSSSVAKLKYLFWGSQLHLEGIGFFSLCGSTTFLGNGIRFSGGLKWESREAALKFEVLQISRVYSENDYDYPHQMQLCQNLKRLHLDRSKLQGGNWGVFESLEELIFTKCELEMPIDIHAPTRLILPDKCVELLVSRPQGLDILAI